MSVRKNIFIEGKYYHIYNRGNSKQKIFLKKKDYDRFMKLLYLCNSAKAINFRDNITEKKIDAWDFDIGEKTVAIGAWVLMPNHFHLYITIPRSKASGDSLEDLENSEEKIKKIKSLYLCKNFPLHMLNTSTQKTIAREVYLKINLNQYMLEIINKQNIFFHIYT